MTRAFAAFLALLVAAAPLTACTHHRTFGEKVRDTVDPPKGPVEKAGRAVDRATGN